MTVISAQKLKLANIAIKEVFRRNPSRLFSVFVLGLLAGLFGGFGIGAVLPLFSLLTNQVPEEINIISRMVEGFFTFFHIPFTLFFLVSFIALLFVAKAVIQFMAKYINAKTTAEYEELVRNDLFKKTFQATWPYLLERKAGHLERVIVNDVSNGASIILRIMNLILLGTTLLMYVLVAISISMPITLLTLLVGGLLFFLFKPLLYRTRKVAKKMADMEKIATHHINETIFGAKIIKASGVEDHVVNMSRKYFKVLKEAKTRTAFYQYSVGQAFEPIGFIFIAIIFIYYQSIPGFSIISFAAVVYLVQKVFAYMQAAQGHIHEMNEMIPYLQSVMNYRSYTGKNKELNSGSEVFRFDDTIGFHNVSFSYLEGKRVLSNIDFSVKKGEMIGIVGPSGVGKTTLVDLFLRLLRPLSGKILIDGRDANDIDLQMWRNGIRYVSQDIFLLNDTIENNIRFFNAKITNKMVLESAKTANIYDLIQSLPNGFKTVIGERGLKLSGGERQRIALARALADVPQVLLLDEATSSLDNKSEVLIQGAIEKLRGKVTILVIAHRLSTVMNSDKLVVLDNGKIIEQGVPRQLLKDKDSHFYKMYNIRKN